MVVLYIISFIFGQPMQIAKSTATSGASIIQHFNTSKSASIKDAMISGGALRYKSIRDGTVAASPNSVNIIGGRNLVLTFAQLGVTIPIPILGGISVLVHNEINSIKELKNSLLEYDIITKKVIENGIERNAQFKVPKYKNKPIISGYDFDDFRNLIKQSKEEKFIPLVIEAVPNFVERNISADYTEKKIKIRQRLTTFDMPSDTEHLKIAAIAISVVLIFIVGMFIK